MSQEPLKHPERTDLDYTHPDFYRRAQVPSPTSLQIADPEPELSASEPTPPAEQTAPPEKKTWWRTLLGLGGLVVVAGSWLLKLKTFAFIGQFGLAGLSALLTVAIYATIFGWTFAAGLVASLFIHEMGHALIMKSKGIRVNGMVFIPFVGAAVFGHRAANAKDEAEIGIAGPIAGALAASVCLMLAHIYPDSFWAPLAYFGFFLNLFNLIPILPLDGGHILGAIDRRLWIVGFVGLLAFQIWSWFQGNYSWWLLLLVVVAALQLRAVGLSPKDKEEQTFYTVPLSTRLIFTFLYFGLATALFLGMQLAHALMPVL